MSTDALLLIWIAAWIVAAPFVVYGAAYRGARGKRGKPR